MYDILIVGSGPAGLTAAIYASRAKMDFAVVEKDYMGSGQIAITERVDNYPGLYGIEGYDLGEKFREHAKKLGTEFIDGEVVDIKKSNNVFTLSLKNGQQLEAKAVIYAAGALHRHLNIEGENEFSARGVSYCASCDGAFFADKITAVVGGGDTALSDALLLSKICKKVYLVHRRSEFRAAKYLQENVRAADNIEIIAPAVPVKITGENLVGSMTLRFDDGREQTLETNGVFVAVGMEPNNFGLNGLAQTDENGYIIADETGKTSVEGLFAAGDVRTKAFRQVVTAVADGANCVASAEKYLRGLSLKAVL